MQQEPFLNVICRVGSRGDVVLSGDYIFEDHCIFENDEGKSYSYNTLTLVLTCVRAYVHVCVLTTWLC